MAVVERHGPAKGRPGVRLLTREAPPPGDVLTFTRNPPPRRALPKTRLSTWAQHIIICMNDAFPPGTVESLEAAEARDCFGVIDDALDAGQGFPHLWASVREALESEFIHSRGPDYEVITFHIAPAHAHVLIRQSAFFSLDATVERWKAMAFAGSPFPRAFVHNAWAPGYYDTVLVDPGEIEAARIAIDFHASPRWAHEE